MLVYRACTIAKKKSQNSFYYIILASPNFTLFSPTDLHYPFFFVLIWVSIEI